MELVVQPETAIDFAATAQLATEGFGGEAAAFTAERLAWLYGRAFSQPTTVLGLRTGGRKIGHAALVGQSLRIGDRCLPAAALMDVFILPQYRSRDAIGALYGYAERFCREAGIAWMLAVPNRRAVGVNRRLLKLETTATLDIRAGLMPPWMPGPLRASTPAGSLDRAATLDLLARYQTGTGIGLAWTAETLWERLQDPSGAYGLHATDDLLLISAARVRRGVPYALLCGFFPRPGARVAPRHVRAVTAAACRLHRRPLFIYVGLNAAVPLPGWILSGRLRPSLMMVQARGFAAEPEGLAFDRFEAIDFDYA